MLRVPARCRRGLPLALPVTFVALALSAAACGGGNKESGRTPPVGGTTGTRAPAATTFDVSQNDNFLQPNRFAAGPGQEVTFQITNKGSNTHDLRIAGPDGEFETEDDAVVAPVDEGGMKPGDNRSLQWTAPGQAGAIRFRCDFHPTEMSGTITVEG